MIDKDRAAGCYRRIARVRVAAVGRVVDRRPGGPALDRHRNGGSMAAAVGIEGRRGYRAAADDRLAVAGGGLAHAVEAADTGNGVSVFRAGDLVGQRAHVVVEERSPLDLAIHAVP